MLFTPVIAWVLSVITTTANTQAFPIQDLGGNIQSANEWREAVVIGGVLSPDLPIFRTDDTPRGQLRSLLLWTSEDCYPERDDYNFQCITRIDATFFGGPPWSLAFGRHVPGYSRSQNLLVLEPGERVLETQIWRFNNDQNQNYGQVVQGFR
ncbi:hypothetical protein BJ742DRAFT_835094 [Cladochytrium replicatum]|nr:hypothetical protein BJ742DRAFT_835094 [Cladochytrium replicatum]